MLIRIRLKLVNGLSNMKKSKKSFQKISLMRTLFAWALLPVIFIALGILFVKWYAGYIESTDKTAPDYEDISWGKIISNSPEVQFEITDSLKYYTHAVRETLKNSSIRVADVSALFPDFKTNILLLEQQKPILDIKDAGTVQVFEVRQRNRGIYYGYIHRSGDGNFYLTIPKDSVATEQIPLGRFAGTLNVPNMNRLDVPLTILNIVTILSLLFVILGFGFMATAPHKKFHSADLLEFILYFSPIVVFVLYLGGLWNWWRLPLNSFFIPEWVTLLWVLSEVELLTGVAYKLISEASPVQENIEQNKK